MPGPYTVSAGSRYPPGAVADAGGVNFSVYTREAFAVDLLLYEQADSPAPFQVISLDPTANRTYFAWHVYVHGLPPGVHYTWRADGPNDTATSGLRFNRLKPLVDPWARAVTTVVWDRLRAADPADAGHTSIRAMVLPPDGYDWEGDRPLRRALQDSVIYELHVGGFTRHPSAGVHHPGTFAGLVEKIPYLRGPRHHRRRAASRDGLRRAGRAARRRGARPAQLLGLQPAQLLVAPPRLLRDPGAGHAPCGSSATWSRPCTGPASA